MKSYQFATALVTTFLVVYTVLIYLQGDLRLLSTMFIVSPFVVVWLVYNVIKMRHTTGLSERKKFLMMS